MVALPPARTEANVRIRLMLLLAFIGPGMMLRKYLVERMVGALGQSQGCDGSDVEQMEVDEEGRFERCPVALLEDGTILRQHLRPMLRCHVHAYLRVAEVWHTTHHIGHVHVPTHVLYTGRHVQRCCASVKLCALRSAMTARDFKVLESGQALLVLRLCTMDLPNFTFPPDFNFQCSGSLQENGNTSADYPPYPPSLMAGRPFDATFPYSQSFNSRIDWDNPSLYQSLPSLSELLNEDHDTWDTLLPPASQKNGSDASHSVNESQQATLPTGHEVLDAHRAIHTSQQATLPAGREVASLN
ncbi:hypothetical protein P692DRAFT_201808732, partial [Suillus brevipes Sb2]